MEKSGVITRIEHSDWASPLVVVPKANGRVRITGDFKHTVNNQLNVTQYPLQRIEELFSAVSGGKTFSKLDGPDAFHQMELDDSSKEFLVINTHRGLYRYNVLPQGIASSPAIFQEFMDTLLKNIPMTGSFMDDGLCSGVTDDQHLSHLREIFLRMRTANYRLSKQKCLFLQKSLEYVGLVLSADGLRTAPSKVKSLLSIQRPSTVMEVKSFLGLVNFYGSFVPSLADKCEPLYSLTKKDTPFNWTSACDKAFEGIKASLSSAPVLSHHMPHLPIGISCDASPKGLGVVLFHKSDDGYELPIAFASKVLSPTEQRYSQIEREALAIVFGTTKFFKYLCGRTFHVITDHKPLLSIYGTSAQVPSYTATRLQRWALHMSQFNYTIEYRNTLHHGNADALSRHPTPDATVDVSSGLEIEVNLVATSTLGVLPVTAQEIRKVSLKDKVMSQVYRLTSHGWPEFMETGDPLYPFFLRREELTVLQSILMWETRVVVPPSLQQRILDQLHECHTGIVRMKSLARQHVWWPGIDADIERVCGLCEKCIQKRKAPASAPLHPWEFPARPWQRLHMDLAGPFFNRMWLVIVDAHSKWPEVFDLASNSTSQSLISRIRDTICRYGIPEQIVSDNGTQFTSEEFKRFCELNGIRHSTSSVYHPRSNGEAERFIQTFKDAMKAADGDKALALQKFLFFYRVTPHTTTGRLPCEVLQGRSLHTTLDLTYPDVRSAVAKSQNRQKASYDKSTRSRTFLIGQHVWVRTFGKKEPKWSAGVITSQLGPVTFQVKVKDAEMKRHVDQMLIAPQVEGNADAEDDETIEEFQGTPTHPQQGTPGSPARNPGSPDPSHQGTPGTSRGGTPSPQLSPQDQAFGTPEGSPQQAPTPPPAPVQPPTPPPAPVQPPVRRYPARAGRADMSKLKDW